MTPDGLQTLAATYDLRAPRFEAYVGADVLPGKLSPDRARADSRAIAVKTETDRIEAQMFRPSRAGAQPSAGMLISLTDGSWRTPPGTASNDVKSITFTESITSADSSGQIPLSQVVVEMHNVYDPATQRYRYTDEAWPDGGDRVLVDAGNVLALRIGYANNVATVFEGTILQLNVQFPSASEPTVTVTAVDRRERLRGQFRPSVRTGATEEATLAEVAAWGGLKVASDLNTPGTNSGAIDSIDADTDLLTYINSRVARSALQMSVFGSVIILEKPGDAQPPILSYRYRGGLIAFTPVFNNTGIATSVEVRFRTPDGQRRRAIADAGGVVAVGYAPPGKSAVAFATESGPAIVRAETITDTYVQNDAEAMQLALSRFKERADQLFTMQGEVLGDPRLRAGVTIAIDGVGRFGGVYLITKVEHRYGSNGYQTAFDGRRWSPPSKARST